jgi:hypothetical protein
MTELFSRGKVVGALAVGLAASAASVIASSCRSAGMGFHTSRGWPRPFYFSWQGLEGGVGRRGLNWLYFAENCAVWAAVALAILIAWAFLRKSRTGSVARA